jgi:hypothetical protein
MNRLLFLLGIFFIMCSALPLTSCGCPPAAPPVIVAFTATPGEINAGGSATLMWNVTGATSTSIDQGIGNVPVAGTKAVSPAISTTYTLTAVNSAGAVTNSVTVVVKTAPPVIVTFTATPSEITVGGSATLMWNVTGAASTSIDQGIGNISASGNKAVSPTTATTYTLTAVNSGGTVTNSVTVAVKPAPLLPVIFSFTASPVIISAGKASTLSWNVSGATTVGISGIGSVSPTTGIQVVQPQGTTTYTLIAANAAGSVSAQATVEVVIQPLLNSCYIDFSSKTDTCSQAGSTVKPFVSQGGINFLKSQAVVQIDMSTYSVLEMKIEVPAPLALSPTGWILNIGNSPSNNGYGGDGGDFANDSELQIFNGQISVYGDDYSIGNPQVPRPMQTVDGFISGAGDIIRVEVTDQQLSVENSRTGRTLSIPSSYLFRLGGIDKEASRNDYIYYAAFNRTIGDATRTGSGVVKVTFHWRNALGPWEIP